VFLRQTEEESVVVVFRKAKQAGEIRIPLMDTPAAGMQGATVLFGEGKAGFSGKELRIEMPGESISIFALN
jgi:hypothetical protein